MENSWEETLLAVDDDDLQSLTLLRPCKHQRRHHSTTSQTRDSSQLQSKTLDSSQSPSQTLDSSQSLFQTLDSSHSSSRTIPGPAGIFQTAKLRKTRDNVSNPMATHEYIRKVVEDPEEDDDFKRSPWLSAIEYVNVDGVFDSARNASLGDIKKYQKNGKLEQVVAVIKSCTPNQLGDLTVALKDPTGTVSGTIHHKVLTESEFEKGICVGSVLILHKVSVFSPSRSAHYLNITTRNLEKVFYMDSGTSQTQTIHGCKIIDAAPSSDSGRDTQMVQSAFSQERGVEGIMNAFRSSTDNNQGMHIDNGQENVNPIVSIGQQFSKTSNKGTKQKEILKEANVKEIDEHEQRSFENVTQPTEGNKNGLEGTNQVQIHIEPSTVSDSVPVWTDEQLNELFDGDLDL